MARFQDRLGPGPIRITLFGRFRALSKKKLESLLKDLGTKTLRDVTRATTHLVVGAGALSSYKTLLERLEKARQQDVSILSEGHLMRILSDGDKPEDATLLPHSVASLGDEQLEVLNAFDLITLDKGKVAFKDATMLRSAESLAHEGMDWPDVVEALLERRDSPRGRHQIVVGANGQAMLEWDDGFTTLSGQHVLPLEEEADLDDLFEQALDAEAAGDLVTAARFFETCAKADSKDALALFNLGNVRWAMDDLKGATLAFKQAIARDQRLTEAHFNLAGVREQAEDAASAKEHLKTALALDPRYPDALFNLAQLELADKNLLEAKDLFERCIVAVSTGPLKEKAQRALRIIAQKRTAIR